MTIRTSCVLCCCGGANGCGSNQLLFLMYGDSKMAFQGATASELSDSLRAPRDKSTGQGFTFIVHTVRELFTVFEGSTQHEHTIILCVLIHVSELTTVLHTYSVHTPNSAWRYAWFCGAQCTGGNVLLTPSILVVLMLFTPFICNTSNSNITVSSAV